MEKSIKIAALWSLQETSFVSYFETDGVQSFKVNSAQTDSSAQFKFLPTASGSAPVCDFLPSSISPLSTMSSTPHFTPTPLWLCCDKPWPECICANIVSERRDCHRSLVFDYPLGALWILHALAAFISFLLSVAQNSCCLASTPSCSALLTSGTCLSHRRLACLGGVEWSSLTSARKSQTWIWTQ